MGTTIRGGVYRDAKGNLVNAEGKPVQGFPKDFTHATLLENNGVVAMSQLRNKSVDEIAEYEGIGKQRAREIHAAYEKATQVSVESEPTTNDENPDDQTGGQTGDQTGENDDNPPEE